jgi:hypothetical protein
MASIDFGTGRWLVLSAPARPMKSSCADQVHAFFELLRALGVAAHRFFERHRDAAEELEVVAADGDDFRALRLVIELDERRFLRLREERSPCSRMLFSTFSSPTSRLMTSTMRSSVSSSCACARISSVRASTRSSSARFLRFSCARGGD